MAALVQFLSFGREPALRDTYSLLFHSDGYFSHAIALEDLASTLQTTAFDVVVMDHTLSAEERKTVVQIVRSVLPRSQTVALHSSARDCGADLAMDSREGAPAILERVAAMLNRVL